MKVYKGQGGTEEIQLYTTSMGAINEGLHAAQY